jgi:hypothetical protein
MDYVIVFLLGVAVTIAPAVVYAFSQRRPAAAPAAPVQENGPIIILPPAPQPVTHNYTHTEIYNDNRRIEMPQTQQRTTNGPPLLSTQQQMAQYQGRQDGRVFKVVGERESLEIKGDYNVTHG